MPQKKLLALFICLILAAIVCLPKAQASSRVRVVQKRLESLGFDPGPVDGKWGPRTRSALKDFQRARDLEVTGRLNARTKEALGLSGNNRSIEVVGVETSSGDKVDLYNQSYALLVGVSDYTRGWPGLNQIPKEVNNVENILNNQGFQVRKVLNPDDEELENAFDDFIDDHGYNTKNRLLFYYAGHGYTLNDGKDGYLVPTNAPDPRQDKVAFKRKTLDMNQVLAWCRQMDAKHALFLFDSCFSGTIFKQRDLPDTPPQIEAITSKPVRQFITAGRAEESVPAESTFTPAFVDALKYGLGDLNEDGYISGTELGLYLQKKVPRHTNQTPQYGKITDYELSRGDFVFLAGGSAVPSEPQPERQQRESSQTGSLQVNTEPNRAKIYVNGEYKGRSPKSFETLSLGPAKVRATKEGYTEQKRSVYIRPDRQMQVTLTLDAAETTGALTVQSKPQGAKWYLDGGFAGKTPDTMEGVKEGRHRIKVVKEEFKDWKTRVWIGAGGEAQVIAKLESTRKKPESGKTWTESTTGMVLESTNDQDGLIILDVKKGSPAEKAGLQRNDIILQANKKDVGRFKELKDVIKNAQKSKKIMLLIKRNNQNLFRDLHLED